MRRNLLLAFVIALSSLITSGCHGQAPVTPQPTNTVSWPAVACPATGYTCNGYIVSFAVCSTATSCPTPGNPGPGPYTALQTAATAIAGTSFTDSNPPTGVYVAYTVQFVMTPTGGAPITGAPSQPSAAQLVSVYPGTPGQPTVVATAALAPPLLPNAAFEHLMASNLVPIVGRPTVNLNR